MKLKSIIVLGLVLISFNTQAAGVVNAGSFDIPVGSTVKGPAMPGQSYQFIVEVKPGEILNFTSMFGISNDWFFSAPCGLDLWKYHKPTGASLVVNHTVFVKVIDAGTEADENQLVATNTAPTQAHPNQGPADPVAFVRTLSQFSDFKASNFMDITSQNLGDNRYKMVISVKASSVTPLSPGVFWVSKNDDQAYKPYKLDHAPVENGLEAQAEDGDNGPLLMTIQSMID